MCVTAQEAGRREDTDGWRKTGGDEGGAQMGGDRRVEEDRRRQTAGDRWVDLLSARLSQYD